MPLNPDAKRKLVSVLNEAIKAIEENEYEDIHRIAHMIAAIGSVFKEDSEWSKEMIESAVNCGMVGSVITSKRFERFSKEKKDAVSSNLKNCFSDAKSAVNSDDWLAFHKAFREIVNIANNIIPY